MHILYFHQHYTNSNGSGGTRSYEFAKRLLRAGHDVTIVCGRYAGGDTGLTAAFHGGVRYGQSEGIRIIEFDLPYGNRDGFIKRSITFLRYAINSVKIACTYHYDLLFATSTPLTASLPGIAAKIFRRKPFIFEVRDLWPELPKAMGVIKNPIILKMMALLEKGAYRCANHCIGLAPGIVAGIRQHKPQPEAVTFIPNGCDMDLFENVPKSWPSTAFDRDNPLIAIFSGTHGVANGLDHVLNAAVCLKARKIDYIQLWFVGDGKLKSALQARAEAEGLEMCRFFGAMPKHELANLYQKAHLGLMILKNVPAFYNGTSPNKFFDYLASGLPVLVNYPGWVAELLKQNDCGIMVQPEDAAAFTDGLVGLANAPDKLSTMGNRAAQLAREQFNRDKLSMVFIDTLERIFKQR